MTTTPKRIVVSVCQIAAMSCVLSEMNKKALTWKDRTFSWMPKCNLGIRHAFFEDLKLYWIPLKMFGMLPYQVDLDGEISLNYISKEMLYSLIVYFAFSIPSAVVLHKRGFLYAIRLSNFDEMMLSMAMACFMLPQLLLPQTHWIDLKKAQSIFKTWRQFQKKYEEAMGTSLNLCAAWRKHVILLVTLFASGFIVAIKFFSMKSRSTLEFALHIYNLLAVMLHDLLLVHQGLIVLNIAKTLRIRVGEAIRSDQSSVVRELCGVWLHLSEVTTSIGTLFFRMHIHLLMITFMVTTISYYALLLSLSGHVYKNLSIWYPIAIVNVYSLWVYLICEIGENLSEQVAGKFKKLLLSAKCSANSELKYEIDCFLRTISALPPSLTFNGFVTVNRRLLVTLGSTMVTYLIVVFQFSQDFESLNETRNSTVKS